MAEPTFRNTAPAAAVDAAAFTRPGELSSLSSTFGATPLPALRPGPESVFDVCHVGLVLRALLFVHAVVAIGVLFVSRSALDWAMGFALGAGVAVPALLLWLVAACLSKRLLSRLRPAAQAAAAVVLGALSGAFGWGLQAALGFGPVAELGVLAPAAAGAGLSASLYAWLSLRARARLPADTTARLAELQSRIRPHFLFNTLNTAITLARLDPARTEGLLEDLAELFRVALGENGESVSLADEVALAQRYLAIEQIRFGDRLRVQWELDDAAAGARVPPLLLQPLVENAVRHGIEPAADGGTVRIRTRARRGQAVILIDNSVPLAPSRPGNGIALQNVRERLKLLHDVAAQFEVQREGAVHRVQIVVPL